MKIGFSNEQYLETQSNMIRERINKFGGKLYLEFGGKLFDDYHASRVLPGFQPDSKLRMLLQLRDQTEIIIAISATDIENNKVRGDLGITYDTDVLRLMNEFRDCGLYVGSVVITHFTGQDGAVLFKNHLEQYGVRVYLHYMIKGYPHNVPLIVSDEGYGKNDYIETSRPLVIVTAPGPGSGKLATCLSQLYHDHKRGIEAGYAKFETFPIWNLPLKHEVNLAYEAATADLNDVNMIDPFHLEAYGITTVNYNRDVQAFPVLQAIFENIYGECPYKSPTVIRRYYEALVGIADGTRYAEEADKIEMIMKQAHVSKSDRRIVAPAMNRAEETGAAAAAIELADGTIVTGRTSELLGPTSAALLNALKRIAGIPHDVKIISPEAIQPIQTLKTKYLGGKNPRLHTDEVLYALSISAATDPTAEVVMAALPQLYGCQAHCSVMLSPVDRRLMKKLGVQMTCEPVYENKKIFH